jgi:hypothetical protein
MYFLQRKSIATSRFFVLSIYLRRLNKPREYPTSLAFLCFVRPAFINISSGLSMHSMKTVSLQPREVSSSLWSIKDDLALRQLAGIYSIDCECGIVHIGQTRHSIENRVKEHHWHFCLYHPEKSAVAEHSINLDDCTRLHDSSVLAKNPLIHSWTETSGKQ